MDDKAEKVALFRYGLIAPLVLETLPPVGQVGCGPDTAFPRLHDWFRICAFFPRLDPSVGRGNGRIQSEWTPHRGRRRLDSRNTLLYGATLITHNPKDYAGVPNLLVLSCS